MGALVSMLSMRNRGVDVCDVSPAVRGRTQAKCLIWNDRGQYDLLDMPKRFSGVDSVPVSKRIIARCVFACGYFEPCVSWVNDWCSRYCCKSISECSHPFVGIIEVAMGLGGFVGSGLVGIWPHRFSFKGICRYVAMICFESYRLLSRY